jgi:hypothetical protein
MFMPHQPEPIKAVRYAFPDAAPPTTTGLAANPATAVV